MNFLFEHLFFYLIKKMRFYLKFIQFCLDQFDKSIFICYSGGCSIFASLVDFRSPHQHILLRPTTAGKTKEKRYFVCYSLKFDKMQYNEFTSSSSTNSSSPAISSIAYCSSALVSGGACKPVMITGPLPLTSRNVIGPSGNSKFD